MRETATYLMPIHQDSNSGFYRLDVIAFNEWQNGGQFRTYETIAIWKVRKKRKRLPYQILEVVNDNNRKYLYGGKTQHSI